MDYQPDGHEQDQKSGFRRLNRVLARYDGETHIYQFPPEDTERAVRIVKRHVEEDRLHPYAGVMLIKMIREVGDDD